MPTLAALEAAGWDGIQVWCQGCRHRSQFVFRSPMLKLGETLRRFAQRLACARCGGRRPDPSDVGPFFIDMPGTCRVAPSARAPSAADPD